MLYNGLPALLACIHLCFLISGRISVDGEPGRSGNAGGGSGGSAIIDAKNLMGHGYLSCDGGQGIGQGGGGAGGRIKIKIKHR